MNKAGKHIQSGSSSNGGGPSSPLATSAAPPAANKNVINSIMSFLPDNRPITSLQIVEDYEKCPKNFTSIHRTYDQDSDADLWRENNILLFGKQTTRYLCLSKTEGLPDYVVETLKVIADKVQPPKEFSLLSRTADTEQKAWRKRQIAYKLSKRGTVTQAVTDIILCSKLKTAPEGFKLAGDINGVLVCYKTSAIPVRLPPPVPGVGLTSSALSNGVGSLSSLNESGSEVEKALNRLNLIGGNNNNNNSTRNPKQPLPPVPTTEPYHDYEEIQTSFQINSALRPAPKPPASMPHKVSSHSVATSISGHHMGTVVGTLGSYTEVDGVPFVINPMLKRTQASEIPALHNATELLKTLEYDFQLERQILCTMKSTASKNPFFK